MPYTALPGVNRLTRLALAEGLWGTMQAERPELEAAITLQRGLIGLVGELADRFDGGRVPRLSLPPKYLTAKLASGIPALAGEPIQVPIETIRPTLLGLVNALADGGGGEAALAIRAAIEDGRIDPGTLVTMALRREQGALRAAATRAGLGHDLLWLVADLSVAPFAHGLLGALFGTVRDDSPLRSALDNWTRGYCPLCGSWPVLVEDLGGRRTRRCSFCAAGWSGDDLACLYCSAVGSTFETVTIDHDRPARVVQTCGACHGYMKVVPSEASLPFPLLALADLESMDLDVAAMQRGCAKPAVRQFGRPGTRAST
jgi:FdhE protein